jgi:hypothetical protein
LFHHILNCAFYQQHRNEKRYEALTRLREKCAQTPYASARPQDKRTIDSLKEDCRHLNVPERLIQYEMTGEISYVWDAFKDGLGDWMDFSLFWEEKDLRSRSPDRALAKRR